MKKFLCILAVLCGLCSCGNKTNTPPVDLGKKATLKPDIEVAYSEMGGVKTIPVKLNDVPMKMIFDTGLFWHLAVSA